MTTENYMGIVLDEVIDNPLSWIGNYFYHSGEYTVQGSPYSELGYKTKYMLFEWMDCIDEIKNCTVENALVIGVNRGYIVPNVKEKQDGKYYDLLCGRSSSKQKFMDCVVETLLEIKSNN